MDRLVDTRDAMRGEVHGDIGELQHLVTAAWLGAPDYRTKPRDELRQTERLDHIVISAAVQPAHPVVLFAAGCQHDHWHCASFRRSSNPATHLDAGDERQHPVEQYYVRLALGNLDKRFLTVAGLADLEAFLFKVVAQHHDEWRFVLDDQDGGLGHSGLRPVVTISRLDWSPFGRASAMRVPCTR